MDSVTQLVISVSNTVKTLQHTEHMRPNSVSLEASCPAVWTQSCAWSSWVMRWRSSGSRLEIDLKLETPYALRFQY